MMHRSRTLRRSLGSVLVTVLLISGMAGARTEPESRQDPTAGGGRKPSVLAAVTELSKRVTLAEEKIPLGELVRKLAEETGVPLRATAAVADEPVTVIVTEFPARDLLEQLGELLDYRWRRRTAKDEGAKEGKDPTAVYEIWQDLAGKQREEALRRAMREEVERRFREQLAAYVEVASLPEAEIRRLAAAGERRQLEAQLLYSGRRSAEPASPQELVQRQHEQVAQRLSSPVTRSLATLLGGLTAPEWSRLFDERALTLSTEPLPGQLSLPAAPARALRDYRPTLPMPLGAEVGAPPLDADIEAGLRQQNRELQERWSAASGYQVRVTLDPSEPQGGGVTLEAMAAPLQSSAPGAWEPLPITEARLAITAQPSNLPPAARERTAGQLVALELDEVYGTTRKFHPDLRPNSDQPHIVSDHGWRLFDLLREVARAYDVHFIATAYGEPHGGQLLPQFPKERIALYELLDRFVPGWEWDRHGNLVQLRSPNWFVERSEEIPMRFTRRWQAMLRDRGSLPLEEYLAMVTALTDVQLAGLSRPGRRSAFPGDVSAVYPARHILRLLASLAPSQRRALQRGVPLPVARMSQRQRQLFLLTVQERDRNRTTPLSLTGWQAGALTLASEAGLGPFGREGAITLRFQLRHPAGPTESLTLSVSARP
jgi:hypothetical protein